MEPFTLDRSFHKQNIIDGFHSIIWTERYYGDSIVEVVVPLIPEMIEKLPIGTFLGIPESREVMMLETANVEDNKLKLSGISLLPWLNNRFVRTSAAHEDRYFYLSGNSAGKTLWLILSYMCVEGSPYLNGTYDIGIIDPNQLVIPGLNLLEFDDSGSNISVGVPFGPVYDALKTIATSYFVGMRIELISVSDTSYVLGFQTYKGADRTSDQTDNPTVRFAENTDTLTNIKELQSIAALKTLVYAFAPTNPEGLATGPGIAVRPEPAAGFDLRAQMVFSDDITTDAVEGSSDNFMAILHSRARDTLNASGVIIAIDGEVIPQSQIKYGVDYNLGDIVEQQGSSGAIQKSRITEYIRSHDATGEKSYPTIEAIG